MEKRLKILRIVGESMESLFYRLGGVIKYELNKEAYADLFKFGYYPFVFDNAVNLADWASRMDFYLTSNIVIAICNVGDKLELPAYIDPLSAISNSDLIGFYARPPDPIYRYPEGTEMWRHVTPIHFYTSAEMDNFWFDVELRKQDGTTI